MKRDYSDGINENIDFFVGTEVEKTVAYGLDTLFITGIQEIDKINELLEQTNVEHIFFGANHSFNPIDIKEWKQWIEMICYFLDKNYLCTLDIPYHVVELFTEYELIEYNNFIPQIRIAIPYIGLWNYNTSIKIDDKDFNHSNPGVWCHNLHELLDRKKFTTWKEYGKDRILK